MSYVFLIRDQNNIYACTGGYGSNYINKFIVKNFGLYLLPKLIGRDNQVIKSVAQNVLVGNQASTNKVNRNSTSVSVEQDMSGIFRQINVEADRNIAEDIGVTFDEEESDKKKVNIVNKDDNHIFDCSNLCSDIDLKIYDNETIYDDLDEVLSK
mgnify:CR=1 FL=1